MNLIRWRIVLDRIPCGGTGQFGSFGVSVSSRQVLFVNQCKDQQPGQRRPVTQG